MTIDDKRQVAAAVATIFGHLSDDGAEAFERLCRDEKLVRVCRTCNYNIALDEKRCSNCVPREAK